MRRWKKKKSPAAAAATETAEPEEESEAEPESESEQQSEGAARTAQDDAEGLDYEKDDDWEGPRDLHDDMTLEVQGPENAPDSKLAELSSLELQELLYKEELTRNLLRLREGLEPLPLSAVALLHLRIQEAAVTPARDTSAWSQISRKNKQSVQMRPVGPQQQQRTRPPKKGKKDRGVKNEKGFRSDGSFDTCTHPTCRSHRSHPIECCFAKEKEENEAANKPNRRHKKRYRWVKQPLSDSE